MIAQVELAILARLKAAAEADPEGFQWKLLTTYPEDWDAYFESQGEIRAPAAWVVFAGWRSTYFTQGADGQDVLVVEGASFGVVTAAENNRPAEQPQRHGGPDPAREPGSYALALFAVSCLAGQTLGLELNEPLKVGQLRAVRPSELLLKRRISMYSFELTCSFELAIAGDGELNPAALLALHANWDLPVFDAPEAVDRDPGATGRQLPDDPHSDAVDHVSLEEE